MITGLNNPIEIFKREIGKLVIFKRAYARDLEHIAKDQEFKTAHQTGTGMSMEDIEQNRMSEKVIFGLSEESPPIEYPKYGYLDDKEQSVSHLPSLDMYGDVVFEMKNDVKRRSTFSIEDTIFQPPVTSLVDIDSAVLHPRRYSTPDLKRFGKTKDIRYLMQDYFEVQMFGRVDLDDVEAIWYHSVKHGEQIKKLFPDIQLKVSPLDLRLERMREQNFVLWFFTQELHVSDLEYMPKDIIQNFMATFVGSPSFPSVPLSVFNVGLELDKPYQQLKKGIARSKQLDDFFKNTILKSLPTIPRYKLFQFFRSIPIEGQLEFLQKVLDPITINEMKKMGFTFLTEYDQNRVPLRFDMANPSLARDLEHIAKDREFKNAHQTKTGASMVDIEQTRRAEQVIFGLTEESPPIEYPKYGYLDDKEQSVSHLPSLDMYGDVVFEMKNDVKRRSTFSVEDTIFQPPVSSLVDIDSAVLHPRRYSTPDLKRFGKTKDIRYLMQDYFEVQMFGRVDLDDVEAIWYHSVKHGEQIKKLFPDIQLKVSPLDLRLERMREQNFVLWFFTQELHVSDLEYMPKDIIQNFMATFVGSPSFPSVPLSVFNVGLELDKPYQQLKKGIARSKQLDDFFKNTILKSLPTIPRYKLFQFFRSIPIEGQLEFLQKVLDPITINEMKKMGFTFLTEYDQNRVPLRFDMANPSLLLKR